jgi:hypothetical protein
VTPSRGFREEDEDEEDEDEDEDEESVDFSNLCHPAYGDRLAGAAQSAKGLQSPRPGGARLPPRDLGWPGTVENPSESRLPVRFQSDTPPYDRAALFGGVLTGGARFFRRPGG